MCRSGTPQTFDDAALAALGRDVDDILHVYDGLETVGGPRLPQGVETQLARPSDPTSIRSISGGTWPDCQPRVHERNDGRTLTHGRGDPLHRSRPHVSHSEDPGDGRCQVGGRNSVVPLVDRNVAAGEDKAVVVDGDLPGEPVGVRRRTEEQEQPGGRPRLLPSAVQVLSLIHISEPTRPPSTSRMPSSA